MRAEPLRISLLRDPIHFLALGAGAGLSPYAPGTVGTLVALLPVWFVAAMPWPIAAAIAVLAYVAGVFVCGRSSQRLGVHDHPGIVFDEIAAMLSIAVFMEQSLTELLLVFILFRIYDIWKPWPIRDLDHRLHGGTGIMLDDQMAAVYAVLSLVLIRYGIQIP